MGKDLNGKELGVGLLQRKDGLYQARFTDRWFKRRVFYDRDLETLKSKYNREVAENELRLNVCCDMTLDLWFERWMEVYKEKSIRPNTKLQYVHVYRKNISPYLGQRKINTLIKSDIQQLIDMIDDAGYKYERQSRVKIILRDLLQRAVEDQLIVNNPVSGIKLRAEKENNAKSLTVEEQITFFDYCRNTFYENLFRVAVNTGLRPGELFALTIDDVDFETSVIKVTKTLVYQKYLEDELKEFHVEPPKTKTSNRTDPMNSMCREYMKRQMELKKIVANKRPKEQNDYLFVTKYNTPLNAVIYSDAIKAVVRQINLMRPLDDQFEEFSGHTFRHTFATRCFEAGIDPKVVQKYLGHASINMTLDLYMHVTEEKAFMEIEKIAEEKDGKVIEFQKKLG